MSDERIRKCLCCFSRRTRRGIAGNCVNVSQTKAVLTAYLDPACKEEYIIISDIAKTYINLILEEISASKNSAKKRHQYNYSNFWLLLAVLEKDNPAQKKCADCLRPPPDRKKKKKRPPPAPAVEEKKPSPPPVAQEWAAINWDSPLFPSEPFLEEMPPPIHLHQSEENAGAPSAGISVTDDNFVCMLNELNAFLASDQMCHLQQEKPLITQ